MSTHNPARVTGNSVFPFLTGNPRVCVPTVTSLYCREADCNFPSPPVTPTGQVAGKPVPPAATRGLDLTTSLPEAMHGRTLTACHRCRTPPGSSRAERKAELTPKTTATTTDTTSLSFVTETDVTQQRGSHSGRQPGGTSGVLPRPGGSWAWSQGLLTLDTARDTQARVHQGGIASVPGGVAGRLQFGVSTGGAGPAGVTTATNSQEPKPSYLPESP